MLPRTLRARTYRRVFLSVDFDEPRSHSSLGFVVAESTANACLYLCKPCLVRSVSSPSYADDMLTTGQNTVAVNIWFLNDVVQAVSVHYGHFINKGWRRPPTRILAEHRLRWASFRADEVYSVFTMKPQQRLLSEVHQVNRKWIPWSKQVAHFLWLGLGCQICIEWIDSRSNPADGLSRRGLLDEKTRSQGWHLQNASIYLGTGTRMHQIAYSMRCGRTLGFVGVVTLDSSSAFIEGEVMQAVLRVST